MMDKTVMPSTAELMATIAHTLNEEYQNVRWRISGGVNIKAGIVTIIVSSIPDDEEKEQDDTN